MFIIYYLGSGELSIYLQFMNDNQNESINVYRTIDCHRVILVIVL